MSAVENNDTEFDVRPLSPYPGLRSFQSDDSSYFFGRDVQIREIVARLRSNRFVAVIGGSGSGKSSLVLAGAIPRLRAFAIKDAGDAWIPVVATPGTNHVSDDGPLHRLARKFCSEVEEAEVDVCVELLRQRGGLGRLVERFGARPKDLDGLDPDQGDLKVNYLFLIDQFEELFHPSNVARPSISEECRHLANRIIEQFKQPHAQVCVALTMRSEHLNDCPRYADLPDVMNGAGYLVKRLNGEQLRAAIEEPATRFAEQRMARAHFSSSARPASNVVELHNLPERILFEKELVERLLRDSAVVLEQPDHADHLPLLQHLLFCIWREATTRCGGDAPDQLTMRDLCRAVNPSGCDDADLVDHVNTLEACLENRCEAIFNGNSPQQANWALSFRCLAFKEPNSGSYTQQRVSMRTLRAQLRLEKRDDSVLRDYLAPWLEPHAYLNWDADSQTVKVAHETLIRRWYRFRRWIDEEDRQFQVYLRLLEDCAVWEQKDRDPAALSGSDMLRRYDDAGLAAMLADGIRAARFGRLLALDRDGERLKHHERSAPSFLDESLRAQQRQEQRQRDDAARARALEEWRVQMERDRALEVEKTAAAEARANETHALLRAEEARSAAQNLRQHVAIGAAIVLAVGFVGFGLAWQHSSIEGQFMRSYRDSAETWMTFAQQFDNRKDMHGPLQDMLEATNLYNEARLRWWPESADRLGLSSPRLVGQLAESRGISAMRTVLLGAPWNMAQASDAGFVPDRSVDCKNLKALRQADFWGRGLQKVRFFPRVGSSSQGLLVKLYDSSGGLEVSAATNGEAGCLSSGQPYTVPRDVKAEIGVAATAAIFVVEFSTSYQVQNVLWDGANSNGEISPGARIVKAQNDEMVLDGIQALRTWRQPFSTDIELGKLRQRLFDSGPSVVSAEQVKTADVMTPVAGDDFCKRFGEGSEPSTSQMPIEMSWELHPIGGRSDHYCLNVSKAEPVAGAPFLATLYRAEGDVFLLGGKKRLPILNQVVIGPQPAIEYRIDPQQGLFAFKSGVDGNWRALPCSLDALQALAMEVQRPQSKSESLAKRDRTTVAAAANPLALIDR